MVQLSEISRWSISYEEREREREIKLSMVEDRKKDVEDLVKYSN